MRLHFVWSENVAYKATVDVGDAARARMKAAGVNDDDPEAVFEYIEQENDPDLTLDGVEVDGGGKTYESGAIV